MVNLLSIEALEFDKAFAKRQLETLTDTPWGTTRIMWEQRLADIDRQIEELRVDRRKTANVALVFDGLPVVGQGDIRLDFTTEVLGTYQKIIAASLASIREFQVAQKGVVKGSKNSKLYIRDIVRGSMGFVLEELSPPQTEMFDTPLKSAVDNTTQFLDTLNTDSDESFNAAIDSASPRMVSAVQKFTKILKDAGATAKVVGDQHKVSLGLPEVNRLFDRFTNVVVEEQEVVIKGILRGILPDSHDFELLNEQDGVLKGAASDELITKYIDDAEFKDMLLLKPVVAYLRYTRTYRASRLLKEQVTLENLEPVG